MAEVFVASADLEVVLNMAGELEHRSVEEIDAMVRLWSVLVPEDEAARRTADGLTDVEESWE